MKKVSLAFGVFFLLTGCARVLHPTVGEDQIKKDLLGQKFPFAQALFVPQVWTIEADELKGWHVQRRATDYSAGTDAIYAAVRLVGGKQAISGTLKIVYRLYDQGWELDKVSADSDFSLSTPERTE